MSNLRFCRNISFSNTTGKQNSWETAMRRIMAIMILLLIGPHSVWSATPKWTIDTVVDNTTRCPGTTQGYFNPSFEFPAINGEWVVFIDGGYDGCAANDGQSIWSYNLVTKKLTKLVDTDTEVPVPAGVGKFAAFLIDGDTNIQVNNGTVLFYGADNGKNSKYPQCDGGLYTIPVTGGTIHRVVDYTMTLPGKGGYFCGLQYDVGYTGIEGMSIKQAR